VIEFRPDPGSEAVATGRQKVAFLNADTGCFMPMPEEIRRAATEYAVTEEV